MKKGQVAFSEGQQQFVNSGNNISFPFLKFESSASVSEQIHFSYRLKNKPLNRRKVSGSLGALENLDLRRKN